MNNATWEDMPATQPSVGDRWPRMPCACASNTSLHRNSERTRYWERCEQCGCERDLPSSLWRHNAK